MRPDLRARASGTPSPEPLLSFKSKEFATVDAAARMTSKGQVTVPKEVREALGLGTGDTLLFRVEGERAVVTRIPSLLELGGSIPVPPDVRGAPWDELRSATHRDVGLGFDRTTRAQDEGA